MCLAARSPLLRGPYLAGNALTTVLAWIYLSFRLRNALAHVLTVGENFTLITERTLPTSRHAYGPAAKPLRLMRRPQPLSSRVWLKGPSLSRDVVNAAMQQAKDNLEEAWGETERVDIEQRSHLRDQLITIT
ncbi:hypothetical protein BB8028_0004g06870 [Beauveria bassiana]|uniref:Uncharacterized protein n=1 Tax=Beauveria bassiana TaxID=176275 RepID=A0A2S7YC88_BEABA|nr:hypothetical protein BB8028_0004g06870 [Beauveria bassiana]